MVLCYVKYVINKIYYILLKKCMILYIIYIYIYIYNNNSGDIILLLQQYIHTDIEDAIPGSFVSQPEPSVQFAV